MKQEEDFWRRIDQKGFYRYEISRDMVVRIIATKKVLPHADIKGQRMYRLITTLGGRRSKMCNAKDLLFKTFDDIDDGVPQIIIQPNHGQYSANEDDYEGKFDDWKILKAQIDEIKRLKALINNEES